MFPLMKRDSHALTTDHSLAGNLGRFRREMDDLFESFFGGHWPHLSMPSWRWQPKVTVDERDNAYVLQVELPGVEHKDLKVEQRGDTLTIKASRLMAKDGNQKRNEKQKTEDQNQNEESYTFEHSLSLPDEVDKQNISADLKQGVLQVTMPKNQTVAAKTIHITGA